MTKFPPTGLNIFIAISKAKIKDVYASWILFLNILGIDSSKFKIKSLLS